MMDNVITAVACVAGVKAYPELIVMCYAVIDPCQLFERTTDLRTFSGHGLKCDKTVCVWSKYLIKSFDDLGCACLNPGAHMRAGMEDKCVAPAAYRAFDFFGKEFHCEGEGFRFYRIA